ncbi:hypothetical protein [Burkholderia stagnalis]|uniref:hypothetical protein n=1 Tax=Burkholderia stagnalis TaxID=1503054 RepID=UPI000A6A8104|nr:hypothetical protein [Burkholderia stagnalis]
MTDQEKGSKLGWKLGLSWNIFLSIGGVRGAGAYVGGIGMLPGGHRAAPRSRKTVHVFSRDDCDTDASVNCRSFQLI